MQHGNEVLVMHIYIQVNKLDNGKAAAATLFFAGSQNCQTLLVISTILPVFL